MYARAKLYSIMGLVSDLRGHCEPRLATKVPAIHSVDLINHGDEVITLTLDSPK